MGVIRGCKLRFRVNITRITAGESPKNYGCSGDFIGRRTGELRLAVRVRRDAHGASQPRFWPEVIANGRSLCGRDKRKFPCRSSRPTVS